MWREVILITTYMYFVWSYKSGDDSPSLIFSTYKNEIRVAKINDSLSPIQKQDSIALYSVSRSVYGLDYDLKGNFIIWSNFSSLFVGPLDDNRNNSLSLMRETLLFNINYTDYSKLAYDWVHNLLYFNENHEIHVINIFKPSVRFIVRKRVAFIRDIIVNPIDSFIVWSQWEENGKNPKIMKALQDGSNASLLIDSDIKYPYSLTFDLQMKRIYWIDKWYKNLCSIDYQGKNRILINTDGNLFSSTFSMQVFHDIIFWTNEILDSVLATSRNIANKESKIILTMDTDIEAIQIIHKTKQPQAFNKCLHASCSHLCLPIDGDRVRCVCPSLLYDGHLSDRETCQDKVISGVALTSATTMNASTSPASSTTTSETSATKSPTTTSTTPATLQTTPSTSIATAPTTYESEMSTTPSPTTTFFESAILGVQTTLTPNNSISNQVGFKDNKPKRDQLETTNFASFLLTLSSIVILIVVMAIAYRKLRRSV